MNWDALFGIHVPVLELVIRGSCMYWFLFLIFRFLLRRDVGGLGVADILLLVIVADASQNAMAGEYKSISEGALLVGTIALWNVFIDRMSYAFPWFERFARPRSVELVHDGRLLNDNLRRERMSRSELHEKLREHGIDRVGDVHRAYLESDGKVSVIADKPQSEDDDERRPASGA